MGENQFSVSVLPDKKNFKEFGRIHMKKSRSSILFLILAIVFYAAYFVLTAFTGMTEGVYLVTAAYLFAFYWLFMGDFIGQTNYKGMNKKYKGGILNYYFGQTGFSVNSEWENSNIRYGALECICESKTIFALYTNKTVAHIIPKSAFKEGTPAEFRRFMEEKTGSKVRRVYTQDKTALKIVVAVLIFAVMMGGVFLATTIAKTREPVSMPYTHKEYTISLPGNFDETGAENCYFAAQREDALVFLIKEDRGEVERLCGELTLNEYALIVAGNTGLDAGAVKTNADGTITISYTSEVEGEEYYYYGVFAETENAFYVTYFTCLNDVSGEYMDDFRSWSETIKIKE